jgi:thymidylate synthase
MKVYLDLLQKVLDKGVPTSDRTGIGTRSLFGTESITVDLAKGFPLLTTKKVNFKSIVAELAGFLEGTTSLTRMRELGTNIWDANVAAVGGGDYLGRIYGSLWRDWRGHDQLSEIVKEISENSNSRRLLVTAWDPMYTDTACLPSCITQFQFKVQDKELHCSVYSRSCDIFIGLPFDLASYALLTEIVAQQTGLNLGKLTVHFGDLHLYNNHIEQAKEQLVRQPYDLPKLVLSSYTTIDNFMPKMASVIFYKHYKSIQGALNV